MLMCIYVYKETQIFNLNLGSWLISVNYMDILIQLLRYIA